MKLKNFIKRHETVNLNEYKWHNATVFNKSYQHMVISRVARLSSAKVNSFFHQQSSVVVSHCQQKYKPTYLTTLGSYAQCSLPTKRYC